jgi:beta-galactosidase
MIEYWHWHTLHYGTETYWGGILPHSGIPGRTYQEIAKIGAELHDLSGEILGSIPDADVAMLWDTPSRWALEFQPPLSLDGVGDRQSYPRIFNAFYRGCFDSGLQVEILRGAHMFAQTPTQFAAHRKVLLVPAFCVATDEQLDWLEQYAAAGGHLVIGPRSAYADQEARARCEIQPAKLFAAAGVTYDEFMNLDEAAPIQTKSGGPLATPAMTGVAWADGLQVTPGSGAETLLGYDHPFLHRWAAMTTRRHGAGVVSMVGTVPDPALAVAIAKWIVPQPCSGWADLPASVTVHTSTRPDGRQIYFVHNWSWNPVRIPVPDHLDLRLDDVRPPTIHLAAWDVQVLVSSVAEVPRANKADGNGEAAR